MSTKIEKVDVMYFENDQSILKPYTTNRGPSPEEVKNLLSTKPVTNQ